MLNITLKDGSVLQLEAGKTVLEAAKAISAGLAREACVAKVNGELADLRTPLTEDCTLELFPFDSPEGKHAFWHTGSHILAQAVKRLYPAAKLTVGPAIDNGFYYDIDIDTPFTGEDLLKIEEEMKKIVKEDIALERYTLPRDEAIAFAKEIDEPYKVILIEELPEGAEISFYKQADFTDLCAGPHIMSTGALKAVKLLNVTGAYWKADANNKMLQRVYGIAFPKKQMLDDYIKMMEEAKRRDHRRLGRELDLFALYDEGPGFPFFFPKGMILRNELENYWRELHAKWGYEEIKTPMILNEELWHRSGHWDHYQNNMYFTTIDDGAYAIKPMNCPGGMLAYMRRMWSYRDLPLRVGELGLVHRHELSGALHGLVRVRCFTQDDAHIFMTEEQIPAEIAGVIELIDSVYKVFGFEYHVELSTCPEDFIGTEEMRKTSEDALRQVLEARGMDYVINEGDGAFYGPKIDFHLEDSIGRTWQCGTIQLDFQLPMRFEAEYMGSDGQKHRPVMIHRVVLGSIERFIGVITEHFAGAFPTWLSPVQVKVLPLTDRTAEACKNIADELDKCGLRVEVDYRNEKLGYKIREAQLQKIPYMLVVGDRDVENGVVSVRSRKGGDLGAMTLDAFKELILKEVADKTVD
ncbi:MAG: threonine--tRNA ligase [Clostridia bacterium]|nr:threonine--tRNA ligase [Clostridia bacterium]